MNRTEQDNNDYEEMQRKWMFDVLMEAKLAELIQDICSQDVVASMQLEFIFKLWEIPLVGTLKERLEKFREGPTWTMVESDPPKLEVLHFLWRVKAVRSRFVQPGQHLSSTDTDEKKKVPEALRRMQDPQLLKNIEESGEMIRQVFEKFIVPYKTSDPLNAREFEHALFPPIAAPPAPPARQYPPGTGKYPTDSESSTSSIYPKSSFEEVKDSPGSGSLAHSKMGTAKTEEEETNDSKDEQDSSTMQANKRHKSEEGEG
mmetsp:Transcript_21270/g.50568  ORF Transcript_21270/g.50568 Transcript_21270/m.50568 type:complete len:259 (-) Transcript_21270:306-1082(-)|eukprot:CAMPEP_0113461188 /NCGR_PEP_ID=MMETSP0014_2-20120614/11405_1 /TAXON_ID=2857 /ORGANISM="Nitzschia sp." /LENGTH=258 /DNA_ID=CAMNT_0000352927 /DNA_START=514 /DNA_END=1290 /DNA_ORIENTATION=+ /assembly_acc=CAM_ASM_000159